MNVQPLNVNREDAQAALRAYRQHRSTYDTRDWEIERIYRAIARGKTVISVQDAIVRAGFDNLMRPRLAICEASARRCICDRRQNSVTFGAPRSESHWAPMRVGGRIEIAWPGMAWQPGDITAILPRIPPQYRPAQAALKNYHILWEADWMAIPRDPYLLRRIGKDAWVVLAAWDLTDVEVSVLRAHQERPQ